jgi:hypothetical protein
VPAAQYANRHSPKRTVAVNPLVSAFPPAQREKELRCNLKASPRSTWPSSCSLLAAG